MKLQKYDPAKILIEGSFELVLNMNDTFGFACAEVGKFETRHYEQMAPIIAQYGHAALTAYEAVRRDAEPIQCPCGHDGPDYRSARAAIEDLGLEWEE